MRPSRRELWPWAASIAGGALLSPGAASAQDTASALDAAAGGTILPPGVHRVVSNTTVKGDLLLQPGAIIEVAAGRTLTLLGGLIAPIAPIFTGPGRVDLNRSRIVVAHPEWWGAAPGDGNRDSLPALRACLLAHPTMQLLVADYYIADTFIVDRPFCRIIGSGFRGTEPGCGTRIIVTSGTADVMRVGPAESPGAVNNFLQNISVESVALCRSRPVDAADGLLPVGLRAQFLLFADFRHISAQEHGIGFAARGLVRSTFSDCVAFRSLPGRQAQQPYRGFLLDGLRDIGLAGGNASLFLRDCNATIGGYPAVADPVGLLLEGAFADSFISDFETAGLGTGIRIDGKTTMIGGRARNGHIDLHIQRPIIDQCGTVGIDIRDTAPQAQLDIASPYVAVAPGARAAVSFRQMRGTASITGGQFVGTVNLDAHGDAIGLWASDSRGLLVSGLKILEHARPVVVEECQGFALRLAIANPDSRPGGSGMVLRDCDRGTAEILLSGQSRAFASGIRLEGAGTRLRIDTTGIDSASVGGAANRVMIVDRSVTAPFRNADLIVEGL